MRPVVVKAAYLAVTVALIALVAVVAECLAGERTAIKVQDGDTFWVKVRLAGVDAPELRGECEQERRLARRAAARLREIVHGARKLVLVPTGRWDRYGRLVAHLSADGRDVGAMLIAEDLARPWKGRRANWCF